MRHLLMRHRAYENRMRRQEVHLVGLRNEVRSFMGGEPIDPYDTSQSQLGQDTNNDSAARNAMLRQMDLSGGEEIAPEDLADELD